MYSVVPSEDAHGSEYVAPGDKRRQWISGYVQFLQGDRDERSVNPCCATSFTGSAGQAIISMNNAYLVTDSRYWIQATHELNPDYWVMIPAGAPRGPTDWVEWLVVR